MVSATRVVTDGKTDFEKKLECADVRAGLDVRVRGWRQTDGSVLAQRIEKK
jgi:hypothetical protein